MNPPAVRVRRAILATSVAALLASASSSVAQSYYWDTTPDGDGQLGGSGIWNATNAFWDGTGFDLLTDNVVWPNNTSSVAVFGGTAGTVTLNRGAATTTANGLTFNTSGYTLNSNAAGDTLTLGGTTPTITVTNAGDVARVNSVLTGTTGFTTAGSGQLVLGGANTFTGVLTVGSGSYVQVNNALALGSNAAGNYTQVLSGGTLNIAGFQIANAPAPATPGEEIRIAGTGVGGIGALVNTFSTGTNSLGKVVLTADATIGVGAGPVSYNAAGSIVTAIANRLDIRLSAAPTAGQKHLDLAGFTLTKIGGGVMPIVNADISAGNIVVNEGQLGIEGGTLLAGAADGSGGAIQVNPSGKLSFYSVGAANITRPIIVNGGALGDIYSSSAAETVASPVSIQGAQNPNFVSTAQAMTFSGLISTSLLTAPTAGITQAAFTGTEIAKRGGNTVVFSNQANSFSAPVAIYAGNLQGTYTTAFSGGTPSAPTPLTGTPLGTGATVNLMGGTLNIRVDGSATTNEVFSIGKTISVDRAPSGINLDRISANTDKNLSASILFQPSSAANGWSIGQNQLTVTQTNAYRLMLAGTTLNNDTVLNVGDFTFSGDTTSANKNSLLHTGGNSWGFIGGTHDFNALFNVGTAQLRIGAMYGTGVTSNTVTAGTGAIFNGPNNSVTFRTATNIATGQTIDLVSQRATQAAANFEQFTAIPANLRAAGSGAIGVGGASAFGNIDLNRIGDGTFRILTGVAGAGNGTIIGVVSPGAGGLVRVGTLGTATLTLSGTNRVTGGAGLEVGSDLINGGFRQTQSNTAETGITILTGANDYTGGTAVNRGATLRIQNASLGSGAISVFGNLTAEGASGTLISGGTQLAVALFGGSTLRFDSSALTTATDTDRWDDNAAIGLNNSTLQLDARNNNSTTNETVGAISYTGGNTISLQRNNIGVAQIVQLQTPSITRVNGGTLEVTRAGSSGFGSTVKLLAGTAPTVTNGMVTPSINTLDVTTLTNFATFDANGINNAAYTGVLTTAFTAGLSATGIYQVDFAATNTTLALNDNPIIYALKVGGGVGTSGLTTAGANTTITLRSGGLIFSGDNLTGRYSTDGTRTVNFAPNLVANDGTTNIEAVINTRNAYTANLTGTVTADGLTKFGAGTLNLFANSAAGLSGNVYLNQGTVQSFGPTTTSTYDTLGKGLITLAGGQLNLRSNNTAVTGTINQTLENGLSVAQNVPIATLDVNRSGADIASSGTYIFNPATAGSTGLQLPGSAGAQGQTLSLSGANYGVQFGDNAVNTLVGNTTINNAVTVRLNNAPTISGTNPVFTKAGGGTLLIGNDNTAVNGTAAAGTQVTLNAGTLDLRSLGAVGTGATTSLVLNAGTLNLRRDTAGVFGVAGTPYPTTVNGNSTISVDRVGANATLQLGLGKLTLNNDATLTVSNGNTFGLDFAGAQINGNGFINANLGNGSNVEQSLRFLSGSNVSGGSLIKTGGGHLHLVNANNTFDGGLFVNQGYVRLRAAGTAGTGTVTLNPGATIDFNANNNLNAGQKLVLHSNSSYLAMVSVNVNGVTHPVGADVEFSANETGIVGLSNGATVYNNPIDLGALYGGHWSLGGIPQGVYDPRYTAATLGAGADNLYRLGGGGTSMYISISDVNGTPRSNVLTGNNSVRLGFDSGNILGTNGTNYQYVIGGTQDFTGDTVIHRGMIARAGTAPNAGTGKSAFSSGAVDVFGLLSLASGATLQNGGTATNVLTLHPGSYLHLDNNAGASVTMGTLNVTNRIADGQAISLNGAAIELVGNSNNATTETLGDVTYGAGGRLRVIKNGTGSATLTLASLTAGTAKGSQLLLQSSATGTFGGTDKILVTAAGPAVTNGMVDPKIVNITDNTFLTYGANGFANISGYDKTLNATYTAGSLLKTDKVDVVAAALTLTDNPTVYALRTSQNINASGAGGQLTILSGGLINTGTVTIAPNLVFNDGTNNVEAKIYTTANLTVNGSITANGVVKSGNGQLIVNVPQANFAGGWVLNSGDLIFNDAGAAGQSVAGNGITVNATPTTTGLISQALTRSRVVFQRDNGTAELLTFSGGPVKVVNEGDISIIANNDRQTQIPNVTAESTGAGSSVALTLDIRSNRFRAIIPTLTLNSDTTARVYDATNTLSTGYSTNAAVGSLVGTGVRLNKIGNRTLELTGNNSATFTGGSINVAAGTLRVLDSGSLGSATTTTNIERNAALEIGSANFAPAGTLTQQAGSIERWNIENARGSGNYTVPTGVNLQLNTNLVGAAARTITLQGGSLEGFLYTDHVAQADQRTVGSAVTLNLATDSLVGQNILNGLTYEAGRSPTVAQPFGDTYTGAYLRIEGKITGAGNLTKTGLDTVTLAPAAGIANDYGNTSVDMGVLRIAADNALPIGKVLTTRLGGTFDLYGSNQTVAGLGTLTGAPGITGVSVGSSGRIINSGVTDNTLTVANTADFTYNGTIDRAIAIVKTGVGRLELGAANGYLGDTNVAQGSLAVLVGGAISGSKNIAVQNGATFDTSAIGGGFPLAQAQTLKGSGSVTGSLAVSGTVAPGDTTGTLTVTGATAFNTGSTLALEINGAAAFDNLAANGVSLTGTVNLTLALGYTPAPSTSFLVVNNTSAGATSGLFTYVGQGTLNEADHLFASGTEFVISYIGGNGNDVTLTAVPEPSTLLSILGGAGILLGLRRRRS